MKIRIEIDELVLHGFKYHDYHRIGTAIEQELARLISENGLPQGIASSNDISKIDAGSFSIAQPSFPRAVGVKIAKSIYTVWNGDNL